MSKFDLINILFYAGVAFSIVGFGVYLFTDETRLSSSTLLLGIALQSLSFMIAFFQRKDNYFVSAKDSGLF